ncbi:MAG TPA: pyridoxal phosphate-dependent aminotransferase [Gemmatimonadota bacterium]|nr:pyridoxal phosphate-dependent aminotransferase [Gemmatimonadota bacterium]
MSAAIPFANLAAVPESATLSMTARAAALDTPGRPVLSLSAGEPDFATPGYIAEAGIRAIREGRTHYPPAAGLAPLRQAIADHLNESNGGQYEARQVIVSVGAKGALFNALFTLFGPGDRVVVTAPYWVSYPAMIRLARAEPVILETTRESGFRAAPDALDAALTGGAKGVVLNSPCNPTGVILSDGDLEALLDVAMAHQAWVVADEIYSDIRYGGPFASVAARAGEYERIVLVNGFSKTYAMTGWRVGYAAGSTELVQAMSRLQGHMNTNTALPSQYAALAALSDRVARVAAVGSMVAAFARRRDLLFEGLARIPGLDPLPPDGAFYVWIDARPWCTALGEGSLALCLDLLEHERLALVPGSAFGVDGYLRLSFAASEAVLADAIGRLEAAAARLGHG